MSTVAVEDNKQETSLKKETENQGDKVETDNTNQEPNTEEKKTEQTGDSNAQTHPTKPAKKPPVHKTDYEADKVYLYQFIRCSTIPSASAPCLKTETWLRMAGINYEDVAHKMKYQSKRGDLPFVELNGKEISDSDNIIRELSKYFSKDLDEGLTPEQKVISHAFESMLNNHTCWVVRCWRYKNPGKFIKSAQLDIKRTLNSKIPKRILNLFFKYGLKSNMKQAMGHGMGRHTPEEIQELGRQDLKVLSNHLKDDYFFGKQPHLLDCVAFAHLCQFIYVPFEGMKEWMEKETPNLIQFVERMKKEFWQDWETVCQLPDLNARSETKKEGETEEAKTDEVKDGKKKKEAKKEKEEQKKREREEAKKKKEEAKKKKQEKAKSEQADTQTDKTAEKTEQTKADETKEDGKNEEKKENEEEAKSPAKDA